MGNNIQARLLRMALAGTASRRRLIAGTAAGITVFAYGCTLRDVLEVTVGSVEVEPQSITILEGETSRLTVRVSDESGRELPASSVTWASDAPSVFAIDPVTGEGQALSPGQATIWASLLGVRGSASVSVGPGPSISVSEPSLLFVGTVGGAPPDPVTLTITNGGGGELVGLSATVRYPDGAPAGWLSVALAGTSAPASLTVSSETGALGEGVYDASVVVASQDGRVSPFIVTVQVAVTLDRPVIGLSPPALEFQVALGGGAPPARTVQITNLGGGVLSDLQALPLYVGVGGWLSADLTATTAPADLRVQPDPSGLSPGTYIAEVRVTGPGALNTPLSLDVTLTIEPGAVSPAHSTATVPGGTAGYPTDVVVQARDEYGNPLRSGGATVVVRVSGANSTGPIAAADRGDGTYTASYTPTAAGTDDVVITMNGTAISGSPFTSTVAPGVVSAAHSTAKVPNGRADRTTRIEVQARDAYGNPLSVGGETVVVTVTGRNPEGPITAADEGDGTYTAYYRPRRKGTDFVAITMNGTPISGSPFTSKVR